MAGMEKLSVVIIHDNTLIKAGLYKMLNEMFNIKPHYYNKLPDYISLDKYDLCIVSVNIYAVNANLFIPKKHKCIIVTDNKNCINTESDNIISAYWSEEKIINIISKGITRIEEIHISQTELSKREIDVLKLIVKGCISKEIADTLHISINTVLTHRKNITSKLGIKSVSGLSVYAMMNGLI